MIWFVILSIAYFAARIFDILSSQNFLHYAQKETFPLSKRPDGSFNTKINVLASLGVWFASFAVALWWTPYGAACILGPIALGSVFVGIRNFRHKKERRAKQIEILTKLRAGEPARAGRLITRKAVQRDFYEYFPFVWIQSGSPIDVATAELNHRLTELARGPESQWFPRDKFIDW